MTKHTRARDCSHSGKIEMNRMKTTCLCLLAFLVYLFVIFKIRAQPFSDFQFYYEVALGIRRGEPISSFYKYFSSPGYPYLLSFILPIYNHSILIPQFLNAFMLSGLIYLFLRYPFTFSSKGLWVGYLILVFKVWSRRESENTLLRLLDPISD
jgi:hypothetical protein